ncbi:MAG TPA: SRPBCC family protein [Anaeromyxobacter sp.]|nr:SRPBCC family protein [Anaeromyxobacter sp.]
MNPTAISCYRSFRAPVIEAWRHLSRPELMARWLGGGEWDLAHGGEFALTTWNGDAPRGRVLSAAPPVRLEVAWRLAAGSPENHVVIHLEGDGPGSRAVVMHDGLLTEPERRAARQMWKEALSALHAALDEGRDAHQWGESIPVAARSIVARSPHDLWPLVGTAAGIEKWIAHVERFDAELGGGFRLTSRYQGREIVEEGTVEELSPESRVALSWEWAGESWGAPTRVEFHIDPDPAGSSLLILHSGFDRLAPERRLAARRNYAAAWPEVLEDLRRLVAPVAA